MEKEINEINDYLNIACSNNPVEIQERISVIMVYLNRSGEMLADAKKLLRKKKSTEISESVGNKYVVCRSLEEFIAEVTDYLK